MDIKIEIINGVNVVKLISQQLDSFAASVARQQLTPLLESGGKVVLDMTSVDYISSAGLHLLVVFLQHTSKHGLPSVLVGVSDSIKNLMSIHELLPYFTFCETLEDGIKAL